MITKKQQYSDVPFFITPNRFTGDLNLYKDVSAIRQSIKNIIMCNEGERPFDFLFGTSVYQSLFENFTMETMIDLQTKIATRVKTYDDRVMIRDVLVKDEFERTGNLYTLRIDIYYEIPGLNVEDVVTLKISRNR